jgi:hypothetical protein
MKRYNKENLKVLFERFFNRGEAEEITREIEQAERFFLGYPGPEPSEELLADIKTKINEQLQYRKAADGRRKVLQRTASIAAVIVLLVIVGIRLSERGGSGYIESTQASVLPRAIWESEDITNDDADLIVLAAEVEQLENEVFATDWGSNGDKTVAQLEMELTEIDSDFWQR